MNRSPMHFQSLEQSESSPSFPQISTTTRSHLLGSPCPAISSWPAPPPRVELKPTAIAAPLSTSAFSTSSPSTSLRPAPTIVPLSQYTLHHSPIPNLLGATSPHSITPLPRLELPLSEGQESGNSTHLLTMLRAIANGSAPPGAACSPGSSVNCWGRETELRQKIQALEEIVADYERQKFNVLGTFSDFRERVAERERRLEAEYSTRILSLSEEVLGAKKDFEERMKSFHLLQEQFEREKEQSLEKLRQDHQREMQALEHYIVCKYTILRYILEIQKLEEERKNLKTERERLNEGFEVRFRRAESLFESELTAAKMLYTRELQALREHEEALKDELAVRQEEFQEKLIELQHYSKQSKEEVVNCRKEVVELEEKLKEKAAEIQRLAKELAAARRQTEDSFRRLGEARSEAEQNFHLLEEQREQLEQRNVQLNNAEELRARLEQTIGELRKEVIALSNRVDLLEIERDGLRAQAESQMLESVTREKEECAERCEGTLQKERAEAEERESTLRGEFSTKLSELEEQYNGLREHVEREDGEFGPENEKLWEEVELLRGDKTDLEKKIEKQKIDKKELSQAIHSIENKVEQEKDEEEEEEEEEEIEMDKLLHKLYDLERSVEGIVKEKERAEARLEQLQEGDVNAGWKRADELNKELEEAKKKLAEAEKRLASGSGDERVELLEKELANVKELLEEEREKSEKELRRLESQHSLALELKIGALNREHERTVEFIQQREQELAKKLELINEQNKSEKNLEENETQTDFNEEEKQKCFDEEEQKKITNKEALRREKELIELIKQLQAELSEAYNKQACNCCCNKKELRSQSIANTNEHLAFCHKTTERIVVGRHEHWRCSSSNSGRGIVGRMEAVAPQELTPEHSQHRLHSPIGNIHHRISPSHQLFFGKGSSPSSEKAEKRPAWKF
uniref:FAM184 domain-containing protein n=1 Tax=Meloidogyne hapla TaxID=6305 RepID=A0A1I8B5B8_MELHA